jgi:hypothetical protein
VNGNEIMVYDPVVAVVYLKRPIVLIIPTVAEYASTIEV